MEIPSSQLDSRVTHQYRYEQEDSELRKRDPAGYRRLLNLSELLSV